MTSLFLNLTEPLTLGLDDPMVNAIFAGVFIGLGAGMIIASGSTLGGPSVIAKIMNKYLNIRTAQAIFILDSLIVLSFLVVLPVIKILFTIIMLLLQKGLRHLLLKDLILKSSYDYFRKNSSISSQINELTGRGATLFNATGSYEQKI